MASETPTIIEGDLVFNETTWLDGVDLLVSGDIVIESDVTLTIVNTTIAQAHMYPGQCVFSVMDGATLQVENSTLVLDTFFAAPQSSLSFTGMSTVRTTGRFLGNSGAFFAEDTFFQNVASDGSIGEEGMDALFMANGLVNSEFKDVHIVNRAGKAGPTSPGANGSRGGSATVISNVTSWTNCTIECIAGTSRSGGLGTLGSIGGAGGEGGDAEVVLRTRYMGNVSVQARASDGGTGARGTDNPTGDAHDGGDGANGGDARISIAGLGTLELNGCTLTTFSGDGGSGGNGGKSTNGVGGNGGIGADAGAASVEITALEDIILRHIAIEVIGGFGGFGGDYGLHEGDSGTFGNPKPSGGGGDASIKVVGQGDLLAEDIVATARGGGGLDGGGGYDQGGTGGRGGDALVHFRMNGSIEATEVDLAATGGTGGPGGPAFSDIRGNGGDGGDAKVEFTGLIDMEVRDFSIRVDSGKGGLGDRAIFNGADGIPTLDLDTSDLWMAEGVFNTPLDDLHGDAVGNLYNVTFDMESGIPVLPRDEAVVTTWYAAIVLVVDSVDLGKANPLVGWKVEVFRIETGELVATGITDDSGLCILMLPTYLYTSTEAHWLGDYYFFATSPDGQLTKKVREPFTGPTTITIAVVTSPPIPQISIGSPGSDDKMEFRQGGDTYLRTWGTVLYEGDLDEIRVHLHPKANDSWPNAVLAYSHELVNWSSDTGPPDDYDGWGKVSLSQQDAHMYCFAERYIVTTGLPFLNGTYVCEVRVLTSHGTYTKHVEFILFLNVNAGLPEVFVDTQIEDMTFNEEPVSILGHAMDDWDLVAVEVRVDDGVWLAVNGTSEWSYILNTSVLNDGVHAIAFRAFDGEHYSLPRYYTFTVDLADDIGGGGEEDGDDGDGRMGATVWVLTASVLIFLLLIVTLYVGRGRVD